MWWNFINSSSKPPTKHRRVICHTWRTSACRLCNFFSGASTSYHVKKKKSPVKWAKVFMLVHAYGQIFGFYRAHSQRMALHFYHLDEGGGGHIYYYITIHHFGSIHTFRIATSRHTLCSVVIESRGGVFVECVNVSAWLCPRFIPGFFQLVFSRRHCCRSSWRWREVEVPGVRCCCPGLFEYGASGRGRWTIAARPRGPLYDRPGNVEWRPGTGKREKKMTITNVKSKCSDPELYHTRGL